MNGSWSDQDLSRESDLVMPDSQSESSEGEFDSFEEAGDHGEDEEVDGAMDSEDEENGKEGNFSGPQANQNQSAGEEDGYSSTEHHQPETGELEVTGEDAGGTGENMDNSGETLISLDGELTSNKSGEKRHAVLNMHHVDLILDNIDAELNDIINRSLNSEHSEHSFHENGPRSGQTRSSKKGQQAVMMHGPAVESSDDMGHSNEEHEDESASDTGLGTGSHPGDSSPVPNGDQVRRGSVLGVVEKNGTVKRTRVTDDSKRPASVRKNPQRQMVLEFSDVDSICSEDVRLRMEETLKLQDAGTDTLPSQHSHNPSHSHDALPKHYSAQHFSVSAASSTHNHLYEARSREPAKTNNNYKDESSCEPDDRQPEEISSRIQEMVSMALSDSTNEPVFEETVPPDHNHKHHHKKPPVSIHETPRTKGTRNSDDFSKTRQSFAPSSQAFLEHRREGKGFDTDSIATEDFEHVFQTSIVHHEPSSKSTSKHSSKRTVHAGDSSNSRRGQRSPAAAPLKTTDRLTVPSVGKRGKSRSKKKRSTTLPASKPSGLPEYMYLRKRVTESDVGSDSIRTEDYEGHFEVARVMDERASHKYAKASNLPRRSRAPNVQSDPESIQTEEYEQRFRSLMVKQVAGVPVKSFDQVTIASDLESVQTSMVHQKFQDALHKGPEVRIFDEFGDQSDLDPMQMEEVERKYQAILKQKKMEKMRYPQQDGDTDDEGTSDLDSVRAIPSKSEAGSPPNNRQAVNRRSKGQRQQNGVLVKPANRSRDPSPRTSAYNSTRSSPRVPGSPIRSQLTSPWSTPRDISPSPPQRSPAAVGVHPHFPFTQPPVSKSCGNHDKKTPTRSDQPSYPSWQDPVVGRQRAAAWNAQHQDSFSTYEEVESLHSHQCSSLQSLDNSCAPSRLQSFGSTSSSLDQSLQVDNGGQLSSGGHVDDNLFDRIREDQSSPLESDSSHSVPAEGGRSGHLKEKSRRSIIEDDEDEMNSSVAKWVDQSRVETARRRSHVGLPEDPPVRSHEAPEGGKHSCDLTKERSLTALNMQCGDVIPGRSGRHMRLPNETDLELALRVGNASPINMMSRCASVDSSLSSQGSDHQHPEGEWTIAEDVLINLGFAGSNMGIPDRFLKSWREQVLKQRVEEVRRLLGKSSNNYLLEHLPTKPEKASSPKEKVPNAKKEDQHNKNPPSTSSLPHQSNSVNTQLPESVTASQMEDAVMNRQRGADKSRLVGLRRSLKKAATVSSFGQTLSEMSKQGQPNQQVLAAQPGAELPPPARRSPGGGKYSPFHKPHKSSARDRRRKYMKKQSSLPISLETLQEEDETLKPGMVKFKPVEKERPASQMHLLRAQSLEMGDEPAYHCKLKIVMEQPSVESREAMSRQGTTDIDVDEAIADVDTEKKDQPVSMEQYLVVKAMIDSKDSGFENEPSRTGSPQISPRSSEDETLRGTDSTTITTAHLGMRKSKSSELADGSSDKLLVLGPLPQTKSSKSASIPLTTTPEAFQAQHSKQNESLSRDKIGKKPFPLTLETSKSTGANPELDRAAQTDRSGTETSGRRLGTSTDKRRPSLVDIQDDFYQTVVEEEDVLDTSGGIPKSESVSACCQTSPTLHSPLLSPLFFLGSISEHPDGVPDGSESEANTAPGIFVMPSVSGSASNEKRLSDASSERHDSLESVITTFDGLVRDLPHMDHSQEKSDGGLSIITEKEEEQGSSQEPSDQMAVTNEVTQDTQESLSPLTKTERRKSDITGQSIFRFDELHQNSDTNDLPSPFPADKSRNPFKSSDSFYSSPRNSKVDFDFDATIEEDEDGEQYSDAESFSKVTFSDITSMVYDTSEFPLSSGLDKKDNIHDHKDHEPFSNRVELDCDTKIQSPKSAEPDLGESKVVISDAGNKSVTVVKESEVDSQESDKKSFLCSDLKENSHQRNSSDPNTALESLVPEITARSKAKIDEAYSNASLEEKQNEENLNKKPIASSSQDGHHGYLPHKVILAEDDNSSKTDQHCTTAVNASGDKSQFVSQGRGSNEQLANTSWDSVNNPDSRLPPGNKPPTENAKLSELGLKSSSTSDHAASSMTNGFLTFVPNNKYIEFLDGFPKARDNLDGWKLGFDQPQIIRSTSVEAHLNFQRRKLRTLSERSTLYSDGMEPLLSGFGRVVTERSSASTEGFGSFGSDVFRRPLTVTETLQQVAAKLESHVRQRSLVSIQDEEGEEDGPGGSDSQEVLAKQVGVEKKPHRDFEPKETAIFCPSTRDQTCKEANIKNDKILGANASESITSEPSGDLRAMVKEEMNNSSISEQKFHQDESTVACESNEGSISPSSCLVVDTETASQEVERSSEYKLATTPDFSNLERASSKDAVVTNKVVPDNTSTSRRRQSWQFKTSAGRRSSNLLAVPLFGPVYTSVEGNPLSGHSTKEGTVDLETTELQETASPVTQDLNSAEGTDTLKDRDMPIQSEHSDESSTPQGMDTGEPCVTVAEHTEEGRGLDGQDNSTNDQHLVTETSGCEHENSAVKESVPVAGIKKPPMLKRSSQSLVLCDQIDKRDFSNDEENSSNTNHVENGNHSLPTLLNGTNSSVSVVDNVERPNQAPEFVYISLPPSSAPNLTQEGSVVHSQFYRCEKFINVSTSDGKVDFVEAEDDQTTCASRQIPTFRSEVQFFPHSDSSSRSTSDSSKDKMSNCSRASVSLDCPSPVPQPRLSPTFEEICARAGNLMLHLQDALAGNATAAFQRTPVGIEESDGNGMEEEKHPGEGAETEEEEEGEESKFERNQVYTYPKDSGDHQKPSKTNHHFLGNQREKERAKRRKKKPTRDNGFKTSTPKLNPGGRHLGESSLELDGEEEGSSQDHMATIRELLETETKMRKKLDELESSFEEVSSQKQVALSDLKGLREAVHRNKRDIQKAEEMARESMERADGLRSELMVLEYQRDQARRNLQELTQSIDSIKQSHGHSAPEETDAGINNDMLGLSPKEVIAVIKERDELRARVRNGEGDLSPMERSELERQLNHTKQELFNGQKSSRAKVEALQEELEESRHKIEELLLEKTSLAEKARELQAATDSEHDEQMYAHWEERNTLLEQLSGKLQRELDALRHQAHEKDQQLHALTDSIAEKDRLSEALKEKVLEMQREAEGERREAEKVVKEAEGKVRNADVVKELALVELRESLLREKDEEMEQLKISLEKEKKGALAVLDAKTSEMLTITQRSLTEKEEDLKAVQMQLVQHTEEANKMEQQLREQAEEQVRAATEKERREREEEFVRRRREENVEKELEVAKETSRLQGELHVARQRLEHLQTTVTVLKEELDKLREENLAAGRERVEAVSEAREKAREDIQRELDQLREQLAKENLLEADKLRMKLRQQEEELTKLRSEVQTHEQKEARSASVVGSKSILAEINEECKRTAAVIGSTPLKLNGSSIRSSRSLNGTLSPKSSLSSTPDSIQSPGRTQVMAALTNLRISNEELRNYVQSLKSDLERQKRAVSKAQKEKDEEVKKVANTIEKKSEDMDTMKERLIQDHLTEVEELQQQISRQRASEASFQQRLLDKDSELREIQHSMTQWKEETALKMAKKFEEELSKELEIRLQETSKRDGSSFRGSQSDLRSRNSSGNGSPSTASSASDASTIRLLRHLQERVKQLRTENMSLRRSSRGPFDSPGEEWASPHSSNKTIGSDDREHVIYQLQQRVKLLERQLQVAEERCRENAASVSEKTSENNRLQGALTQQTKELMKMERAYSKLATPSRTQVRL